jgi:hypothetical protein
MKTKWLILIGNLGPLLLALGIVPAAVRDLPPGLSPESSFAHVMLAALPALLTAALGALMTLVGGISLLLDWKKSGQAMTLSQKGWLVFASLLPLAFAVLFFVGVIKQNF